MTEQPPTSQPELFSYRRVIAGMLAVLLLVLGLTNYLLLHQQRQAQLAEVETQLNYQLQAAATFMTEPLLKYQFADVEQFMQQWSAHHEDVLLFEAHTPTGHLLSRFSRQSESPFVITRRHPVTYQDQTLLTLTLSKDYRQAEIILQEMRNRLLLISLTITAVLGLMLWLVFRHLALAPLEREISKRRQAEQELNATNKELDAFAYSISHDLRAPLRGIDGFSQALLEDYHDQLDDTGQDYLRRVRAGCSRMGHLIDDMLQLSRLSRGEINWRRVDLSAMAIESIAELQKNEAQRQVEVAIEPNVQVIGDPVLLRAVLDNLLGNAWKFTGKTEQPAISFGTVQKDGRTACFIRDNGAGFDMTYADKVFTAFQRLHSPKEFEGTGIGLATVQRIIHRHGGLIWVEAEEGKGAVFYFTLDRGTP
ncbi:sensor histidine kinase [Desulfurivibrio alkaliphilus]|uniref:histidine kinase n=1 Tax=Desulfurivibrio alkaliphilus (strain DSM 19089 / UNIQEM U267 / AHT2) TaxID=589865 RepID=D6Z3D2_DESAT|nr:ATP-binding protein [Desulfurivibrio alkaliphilus]ADH86057.1 integral membrane sensor signal transduction histidine kinase [Desulfurivibrio alkaliphilus AHT 2]